MAQRIGRHPSYVHEVEAGRIPLVWEVNAELIWGTLIELGLAKQAAQLPKDKIVPPNLLGSRSPKDGLEENAELRKIREEQCEMIRKLEEQRRRPVRR